MNKQGIIAVLVFWLILGTIVALVKFVLLAFFILIAGVAVVGISYAIYELFSGDF